MSKQRFITMAAFLALVTGCTFNPRYADGDYYNCRPDGTCPDECTCLGGDICVPDSQDQEPELCAWCENGLTACDGKCVDTEKDIENCNGCGKLCLVRDGQAKCVASKCEIASCNPPFANCDSKIENGCESNTDSDKDNCSGCGKPCFFAHAGAACESGACRMADCESGFADCNSRADDGCEIKLGTLTDCAGCGDACDDYPQPKCNNDGTLTVFAGTASCEDGCVYQTHTDDCGALGCLNGRCLKNICPDSSLCELGEWCNAENVCLCGRPGEICGGACCDGLCTNLQDDSQNCGACGHDCKLNSHCESKTCVCDEGFGDCDGNAAGCETNISDNDNACGACGTTCVPDASCHGGACSISGFLCNGICDIAGATCCDLGNGYVCTTDYCPGQNTTYCNDPGDCPDQVCCLDSVAGSTIGICKQDCSLAHTVCSSDSQCAPLNCCQQEATDTINGSTYNFYICCED
ncbi:MAG TPA: hypothetical protein VM425_13775 [Myxococcota bacterium]|nr:hypothetical protein [Myxococcota bacterium]